MFSYMPQNATESEEGLSSSRINWFICRLGNTRVFIQVYKIIVIIEVVGTVLLRFLTAAIVVNVAEMKVEH